MSLDIKKLQENLCTLLCAEIKIRSKTDTLFAIETPFSFADGDPYQLYIREMPGGILRLTDMGHTMLHMSYENDTDTFRMGTRGKLLELLKAETQVEEEEGAFFIDTPVTELGNSLFRLGQALTKITDLTFLNRARAESTFYEDLQSEIYKIIGAERAVRDYILEDFEGAASYPIDYKIEGKNAPLFLFGIPNRDKARLTNIILERLLRENINFDSLLVFADQAALPKGDLARLMNAGGEMIASLDAETDLARKLLRKAALN